jgi:hypothetical protein
MFKALSYKQKLKALGFAVIPVLFLCYELSIKRTVQECEKYRQASGSADRVGSASSIAELYGRQAKVEGLFNRYMLDTLAFEKNLLSIASNYCRDNALTLKEYRTVSLATSDSIQVLTRVLTVEGHFIPDMKLVYDLETKRLAGRISSVVFQSVVDHQDKSTRLNCTLYVQNLIP